MKDILPDLDLWQGQGEEIALATVVRVQRSAPRPPGARLCATRSGRMSGSVSGGCVEADVLVRAMQVLDTRTPEVVSYGIADELGFQVGLSCGGSIDVLIEPYVVDGEWDALRRSVEHREGVVYAVGLSPPALLGRKLTRLPEGRSVGSIDPSLDGHIVEEERPTSENRRDEGSHAALARRAGEHISRSVPSAAQPPDCRGYPHCHLSMPPGHGSGLSGFRH